MSSASPDSSSSSSSSGVSDGVVTLGPNGQVVKRILTAGEAGDDNKPPHHSQVTVHYTGRLLDGTKFDSSKDRDEPFKFKLGAGQVIKGWDVGVASMQKGEKAILTITSDYAYGPSGSPPKIPPNATLEFEVELLDFDLTQKVTEDGSITKRILVSGTGSLRPNEGARVTVTYSISVKSSSTPFIVVDSPSTFTIGDDVTVLSGLEESIKNMYVGEKSLFTVSPAYGYGDKGDEKLGVPKNATLQLTITLIEFTKGKETFEMDNQEKVKLMIRYKDQGNHFYKLSDFSKAAARWQKAIKVVQFDEHWSAEERAAKSQVAVSCHSNLATLWAKEGAWDKVLTDANEALKLQPTHVKSLYRKGQAYAHTDRLADAVQVFESALSVDSANGEVLKALNEVKARQRAIVAKERAVFGGWFNKVNLVTDEELKQQREREEQQKKREAKKDEPEDDTSDDDEPPALETKYDNNNNNNNNDNGHGHSHGPGDDHGHSHGGDNHGHSHGDGGDDHGHSHAGDDHGHSHAGDDHGHSHGGDDHGHSHAGNDHGHSHTGGDHGHSH